MAKKKSLFSSFFSIMLKIVPFVFDTLFGVIRFFINVILSLTRSLAKTTTIKMQEKQVALKKPKSTATYKTFQVLKTVEGLFENFEDHISNSKSTIGLILGARGSGKSALGMRFLENIAAKGRTVCAMGFSEESLPSWIRTIQTIDDVPTNSFILIDEGGILFSSRGSMSSANKLLSSFLLVARHKDLSILFISQNSANLEVNAIRQADYLLLRKSSLLQKDFERKKIKDVYIQAEAGFSDFSSQSNKLTFVYSNEFRGYITNELPSFWSEKTSKSFKDFKK